MRGREVIGNWLELCQAWGHLSIILKCYCCCYCYSYCYYCCYCYCYYCYYCYCYFYCYCYCYCYCNCYCYFLPMPEKDSRSPHCFCILPVALSPNQDLSCVWGTSCNRTRTPSPSAGTRWIIPCNITLQNVSYIILYCTTLYYTHYAIYITFHNTSLHHTTSHRTALRSSTS